MRVWRITSKKYALDRLSAGAALYGGRWNPVGLPALYCGASIAISALEKLAHLGIVPHPPMVLVAVDIPDAAAIYEPKEDTLPVDWQRIPMSRSGQNFGGIWLRRKDTLAMKVPSVIVPEEANIVINPAHQDYSQVQLLVVRPFTFDFRLV